MRQLAIWQGGVRSGREEVLVRVPKIDVGLVVLRVLLLLSLHLGKALLLLVSDASRLSRLAASKDDDGSN